ncbi:MAG: single-stranded DNA-binding protein [Candidatus Sericytochromatia bacterium]|nr:single-stranded DNA-binding protein [Candidatus Sericytochromatia bacterium]
MAASHPVSLALQQAAAELSHAVQGLSFAPPVTHVYNPLEYARSCHLAYLERYGQGRKRVLFWGMNPGPYGMAQTGVPFGEIASVRDFLGLEQPVGAPLSPHPARPVLGFACPRSEVSGRRWWGAIARAFGDADAFFEDHLVLNYCPLMFLEASGRNRTPDQLPVRERAPLLAVCDRHMRRVVELLEPAWVIGVGHFAEARARHALAGMALGIGRVSHPSPASPAANRGWEALFLEELAALGLSPAAAAHQPVRKLSSGPTTS